LTNPAIKIIGSLRKQQEAPAFTVAFTFVLLSLSPTQKHRVPHPWRFAMGGNTYPLPAKSPHLFLPSPSLLKSTIKSKDPLSDEENCMA
jgi:hypothetical protein